MHTRTRRSNPAAAAALPSPSAAPSPHSPQTPAVGKPARMDAHVLWLRGGGEGGGQAKAAEIPRNWLCDEKESAGFKPAETSELLEMRSPSQVSGMMRSAMPSAVGKWAAWACGRCDFLRFFATYSSFRGYWGNVYGYVMYCSFKKRGNQIFHQISAL